jgi:hypothetical protein
MDEIDRRLVENLQQSLSAYGLSIFDNNNKVSLDALLLLFKQVYKHKAERDHQSYLDFRKIRMTEHAKNPESISEDYVEIVKEMLRAHRNQLTLSL